MGYYTSYSLDVKYGNKDNIERLVEALRAKELIGYALDADYVIDGDKVGFGPYDTQKWYDHDDDMIEISKEFPDMVFKLYGSGEDFGDEWYTLYRDGNAETIHAELKWPEPERIHWGD